MAENNRRSFVAIVLTFDPPPPYLLAANDALCEFEMGRFAPGTPEADLYQIVLDPTRQSPTLQTLILQVVVFPEEYLPLFSESLRPRGLALVRGSAMVSCSAGGVCRYTPFEVLRELGLELNNNLKTYEFDALGADN